MFTGLIFSRGTVVELTSTRLRIASPDLREPDGASIAVDGCCLTATSTSSDGVISFDLLPETIAATRISTLATGDSVNLEPALRMGDALGGHLVQGHVDATGRVLSAAPAPDDRALDLVIAAPADVLDLCVVKGSITVNGVSLTIMSIDDDATAFRVQLIPETQYRTNLAQLTPDALVNLEADVIARYVQRLLRTTAPNR